jgi:F0F1-type ATP synthase assembly protein I
MEAKNKRSSLKDLVSNPLLKTDSRTMQYSGLGVQLAATIVVFFFLGYWLDKSIFDTFPMLTLIFTFLGFGGAFYNFFMKIQYLSKMNKEAKKLKDSEKEK